MKTLKNQLVEYLDFAKDLAYQAGKIIKNNFSLKMVTEWKADNTPLTITDTQVNQMVIDKLSLAFPDHSILGEEKSLIKTSSFTWVVDPLDGTIPFSHSYPLFTFSLALTYNGRPVAAVIYDVMLDRLFWAQKDRGAYLDNKKIKVSPTSTLARQLMNVELDVSDFHGIFQKLVFEQKAYASTLYSASYGGILTAAGVMVAEVYAWDKPWDGAAVKLIVEEAGGKVTDLNGKEQRYDRQINGFVASNDLVHDKILALIERARTG